MTRPLRLQIRDALNSNIFMDAEGLGIFIGGRRRNRKKKNKKNGQNKKKCKKTESRNLYSSASGNSSDSSCSGRTSKCEDKLPLLSYCLDGEDTLDLSDPYSCFCTADSPEDEDSEEEEEIYNTKMSFLFKKKAKEVKKEKEVVNELQQRVEETKTDVKEEVQEVKQEVHEEVKEVKAALEESVEKAVDGGAPVEQKTEAPATEPEPVAQVKTDIKEEKSEKSPLVNGKDMGPASGLCCTIL